MKVTKEKFNEIVDQYIKGALIADARSPIVKFRLGFAVGAGAFALTPDRISGLASIGIVDPEGSVDLEALKKAVYAGLDASGSLHLDVLGITLERPDADRFFRFAETGSLS